MYNLKWKIYDIKRTPVKKKNIFPPKMHLKNVGFTYKSQTLKFIIQQKVFNKKCKMIRLNVPNFLYTNNNSFFLNAKKCNFLNFLKEFNNFRLLAIFPLKKWFFVNIKKIENI